MNIKWIKNEENNLTTAIWIGVYKPEKYKEFPFPKADKYIITECLLIGSPLKEWGKVKLPPNLTILEDADLQYCDLQEIPDNLTVIGDLTMKKNDINLLQNKEYVVGGDIILL